MAPTLRAPRAMRMSLRGAGNFKPQPLSFSSIAVTISAASIQSSNVGLTTRPVRSIGRVYSRTRLRGRRSWAFTRSSFETGLGPLPTEGPQDIRWYPGGTSPVDCPEATFSEQRVQGFLDLPILDGFSSSA